jgi:hypothetical protein
VKKSLTIFLMSLYLLGATEAYQLLKIPNLIAHYKTHQQITVGMSFSQFIEGHYFSVQTYDSDFQQDMELPFKSSNRTISLLNFVSVFAPKNFTIQPVVFPINRIYPLVDDRFDLSTKLNAIFQPPRA